MSGPWQASAMAPEVKAPEKKLHHSQLQQEAMRSNVALMAKIIGNGYALAKQLGFVGSDLAYLAMVCPEFEVSESCSMGKHAWHGTAAQAYEREKQGLTCKCTTQPT